MSAGHLVVREETTLQDRLRRLGEAAGVRANAFSTAVSINLNPAVERPWRWRSGLV